ncbi:MAG: DUF485 domain-containing protein [Pirellulaceae bacterium]
MTDLNHGTNKPDESESRETIARNARFGIRLFAAYLLSYSTFVLISTFRSSWLEMKTIAGLNLAIFGGFVLIVLAIVLALVYGWLCRNPDVTDQGSKP